MKQIVKLADDRDVWQRLHTNGRAFVERHFSLAGHPARDGNRRFERPAARGVMSERAEPPVVLHAVGDIALGDHPLCAGFGTHSRSRREPPSFPFAHVNAMLAGADLRFGNLECTLSERGLRPNDYHSVQMRGHADYVRGLRRRGLSRPEHRQQSLDAARSGAVQ